MYALRTYLADPAECSLPRNSGGAGAGGAHQPEDIGMHIFTSGRPSAAGDALMRMARTTLAALAVLAIAAVSPVMAQTGDGDDPTSPDQPTFATANTFKVGAVLCKACDGASDLVMINLKREDEGTSGSAGFETNFGSLMDDGRRNGYLVFKESDSEKNSRVGSIESVFIAPGASDTEKANDHVYLQTGRLSPDASLNDSADDQLLDSRVAWKIPDTLEFSDGYEMVLRLRQGHGFESGDADTIEMITLSGDVGDLKQTTITHIYLSDWAYENQEAPFILTSYVDAGGNANLSGVNCADTSSKYCDTPLLLPTGLGVGVSHIGTRNDSLALDYDLMPDLTREGPTSTFTEFTSPDSASGPTLRIDRTSTDLRDADSHVHTATWRVWNDAINAGDATRLRGADGTVSNTQDLYLTKEVRIVLDTDTPAVCPGDASSTFTQLVRNRLVYADELIGTNQTTLQYPSDTTKTPTYEIVARRTIGPGNAGDVTITLQGATFGEDVNVDNVRFVPSPGAPVAVTDTSKITIAYKTGGLAGESEIVFNLGVSAHAGSTAAPTNHRIRAGDRFVVTLPHLTQVNLDQSAVTIGSTLVSTQVSGTNGFPDGLNAISRCVSDRQSSSARSCIYAKTVVLVGLNLGGQDTIAYIDHQDRTKFAARGPVTRMSFPPGFNNNGSTTTTHTNVLSMGTVTFDARPIPSYPNPNACSDPFGTDVNLQPLGKDGNPYRFGSDDMIVVTLEPNPTGANGLLLMKRIRDSNGNDPGTAVEIIPASANGFAEIDLSDPENIFGEWEFFFMPGFNEMRYGETRTMMAEVRFGDGDYMNRSSSPGSRTITLTVDGIGTKALAYALPPPQSPDESFIRIRCEQGAGSNGSCQISLECYNHSGNSWFADVSNAIPSGGVTVLNRSDISSILAVDGFNPATDWGADAGRLSCQIYTETDAEVSTQVLVRSGGSLTNNTFVDLGAN